ncbi:MAG: hypothetical protein ACJAW1_003527 [Glaciecola sp.]
MHSAIHLLLNDDIEKGLRDCLDLHALIEQYSQGNELTSLHAVFEAARCEDEFFVLLMLLTRLFGVHETKYANAILNSRNTRKFVSIVNDLEQAVFPASPYISDSSNTVARFKVYLRGHLSKMPLTLLIKHLAFKAYRTLVKKLLGEYFFKKENKQP